MRRAVLFAGAGLAVLAACSPDQAPTAPIKITPIDPTLELSVPGEDNPGNPPAHVDFIRGITRGAANGRGGGGPNPNLTYHGGPVMTQGAVVQAIFWGTSWNDALATDDKITGLATFYGGLNDTPYARSNIEYTDGSATHVSAAVTFRGTITDLNPAPNNAPSTSTVLAKVCAKIQNPVANGYYPVYVDRSRGNAGYCAWHSAGTCGGVIVQFAFFFRLDGDAGCDPQAGVLDGQSQGLAALANVSGHEISEALTDPHLNAWYDRSGSENSDKCAWTFGGPVLIGGLQWKIQGNWSNNAYNNKKGYDSSRGCIQTG